jgi:hypothetical protein
MASTVADSVMKLVAALVAVLVVAVAISCARSGVAAAALQVVFDPTSVDPIDQ